MLLFPFLVGWFGKNPVEQTSKQKCRELLVLFPSESNSVFKSISSDAFEMLLFFYEIKNKNNIIKIITT